ncbi:PREDICTED: uncharacterized protein LOC109581391 isoform X2 [Amphimedon queenslandica]|uniref:Uncharacterized protein n=1 Tax=Amphimedon queenslandica TaxID=400682 RepID=A0AAN0J2R1_AMPQE|nr:PREDICTED: uncharacterized protein LOC109581391 isoform X2 [Amphimedon queenslandica]|eukprot:XP_019851022.1 PREDICTED: uncharacterized protein LOC109581391 isoform X2 [Amphimedon queenslandica]
MASEQSTEPVTIDHAVTEQTEPRTEYHEQGEGRTFNHHQELNSLDVNLVNTSILEHSGQFFDHLSIKDDTASPPETAIDTLVSDMIVVEHEDSRDDDDVARFLRGDPTPLFELDKRAKDLVLKLDDMVNELHSNIDAMSICVHQAISLHSESVDSVHNTVDGAVKLHLHVSKQKSSCAKHRNIQ